MQAFSPCDGVDSVPDASSHLLSTASWFEVTDVADVPGGEGTVSVVVEGLESGTGQMGSRRVDAHATYWPGIEWTLVNGGEVWLGFAPSAAVGRDSFVSVVVAFTAEGTAFFPGECQEAILGVTLRRSYGDDFDTIAAQIVGATGEDLKAVLSEADQVGS
jgi:hypothetical protein